MVRMREVEDRLAVAFHHAAGDCPSMEELAAAALEPEAPRLEEILRHARQCGRCATELELAATFEAVPDGVDVGGEARDRLDRRLGAELRAPGPAVGRPRKAWTAWGGLAAAAALLLTVGLLSWRSSPPPLPERTGAGGEVLRGRTLEPQEPRGEIEAPPRVFRWRDSKPPSGEEPKYRLVVLGVDDEVIFSALSDRTEYGTSSLQRGLLRPRVRYRWRVEPASEGTGGVSSPGADFTVLGATAAGAEDGSDRKEERP